MKRVKIAIIILLLILSKLSYSQNNWIKLNSGTSSFLTYVDFINNDTGLVVGSPGTILKTKDGGKNWSLINSGTTADLGPVCFINKNIAFISGDNGLILKSINGGDSWFSLNSGVTSMLYSLDFIDENVGYAAGMGGLIIKTTDGGATWHSQNSNFSNHIYRIRFLNKDTGFVAAKYGAYARTINGGQTWTPINSGVSAELSHIEFYDKTLGYMTGENGTILKSTDCGESWFPLNSGTSAYLNKISCIDFNTAYTVGVNGTILKTTDRGQTWVNDNSGVTNRLVSISFPSKNIGYAVGANGYILKTGLLDQLSSITGYSIVCQGQQNVIYSIDPNSNFISYSWTYSGTGINIIGNTNSIIADFSDNATSGVLSVNVLSSASGILSTQIQVTINQAPSSAGIITGETVVCPNQHDVGYSVPLINNATNYLWNYTGTGVSITSTANSIFIDYSQNATNGSLTVIGNNNCGNSAISPELHITIKPVPLNATEIVGPHDVCSNQGNIIYSIPIINNSTEYIWNYSGTGASILGNEDSISLYFFNDATSGNLTVHGKNSCGDGANSQNFPIIVQSCVNDPVNNINIPNAFSPNGDGVNDLFIIRGLIENTKIMIFDRFGKMLYESNNYINNWDGKDMDGHLLESDTYWYIISIPGMPSEYKGFVYLKK